jgi:hypothetical protein
MTFYVGRKVCVRVPRSRPVAGALLTGLGLLGVLAAAAPAGASEPVAALQCSRDIGPQAPRDLAVIATGANTTKTTKAPPAGEMSLCNIHFHKYAEHKASGYQTAFGAGPNAGFVCERRTAPKLAAITEGKAEAAEAACDTVAENDTIEVHWVFTSCPAPATPYLAGLANCTRCPSPSLRVEAKVFHVENDGDDFAKFDLAAGKAQPNALPDASGAVEYQGSTTGNSFNNDTNCSPASVTWNVRPECSPLKVSSLKRWCANNAYNEHEVHGVRPLVTKPELLAVIQK